MKQYIVNERVLDVSTFFVSDRVKRLVSAICDWGYSGRVTMREELNIWFTEKQALRELTMDEAVTVLLDEFFGFYAKEDPATDEAIAEFVGGTQWP